MHFPSLKNDVSPQEWKLRCDLAACYRLVAMHGWTDLVFTHISARIPGTDDHFLINPYGVLFGDVTASSLIRVDAVGNKMSPSDFPVNKAGFIIHSALHQARPDVVCVLHTHTRAGVAVSAQRCGLLPISQQASVILPSLAIHEYDGIVVEDEERPRLQASLGDAMFLMLQNHGLLTVGASIADAFFNMYLFETSCQIQLAAQGGGALIHIGTDAVRKNAEAARQQTGSVGGMFLWPALLREVEKAHPDHQT